MAKYSKGASKKVEKVMKEKKAGTLKTGSGKKVTSNKQAIAIGLSEARKKGSKVPKKTVAKKSVAKKAIPKKVVAKKAAPKKAAAKKIVPKKSPLKKSAAKKVSPKKPVAKKAMPKKTAVKKAAPKKVLAKKAVPKKSAAKKAVPAKQSPEETSVEDQQVTMPQAAETGKKDQPNMPVQIPVEENTEKHIPVEEPNEGNPQNANRGNPIPPDKYAAARDTYHGHINPSSSKSKIKPSGKKPLWNS